MEEAPLTGVGQTTGISGESRCFASASESGRNFTQVLKLVMSSCPPCGSNVGSGEDDDTTVNGDWSLALCEIQQHTCECSHCNSSFTPSTRTRQNCVNRIADKKKQFCLVLTHFPICSCLSLKYIEDY